MTGIFSLDTNAASLVADEPHERMRIWFEGQVGWDRALRSLPSVATMNLVNETLENYSGRKVSAVAGLIAVASFWGAEAQQSNLPPVTDDVPVEEPPRPAP